MSVRVRPLRHGDVEAAAALLTRYSAANLTAEERAAGGFVQGSFTPDKIEALTAGAGGWVAEREGALAGVVLTSEPGAARGGPPAALNELAQEAYGPTGYFVYGPAVVDEPHRRRGVLRALFEEVRAVMGRRYPVGVAFVESGNTASLIAHHRLGLTEFGSFTVADRPYAALAFDTDAVAAGETP